MTLKLDQNDPTKTKIQYRNPNWMKGIPRILFVANEPDAFGRQIVILHGDGSMSFRLINGRFLPTSESEHDIINVPPTTEELLACGRDFAIIIQNTFGSETLKNKQATKFLTDYQAWKASR